MNFQSTPFYEKIYNKINEFSGILNGHLHLDRAGTIEAKYFQGINLNPLENSYISLAKKHNLISILHNGIAYEKEDLKSRVNYYLDQMIKLNTFRADTVVDVSFDKVGLSALEVMKEIKHERLKEIDLRLGAYSPLGFIDTEPQRWDLLVEGAKISDFIGSLPERDDKHHYPSHIGFSEHCQRMLILAQELNKPLHIHLDQRNEPSENGTEILIDAIAKVGLPISAKGETMVWGIHVISPSTYEEKRFFKLVEALVKYNIGVICCPSAAISMRQIRSISTPTYNSIARILEMLVAGVQVRLGSDNIADICSPSATANLIDEIFVLSNAIRFYNIEILAKLAAGVALNEDNKELIKLHLHNNNLEIEKIY